MDEDLVRLILRDLVYHRWDKFNFDIKFSEDQREKVKEWLRKK